LLLNYRPPHGTGTSGSGQACRSLWWAPPQEACREGTRTAPTESLTPHRVLSATNRNFAAVLNQSQTARRIESAKIATSERGRGMAGPVARSGPASSTQPTARASRSNAGVAEWLEPLPVTPAVKINSYPGLLGSPPVMTSRANRGRVRSPRTLATCPAAHPK
jgi:hypothetical protein